MHSFVDLIQGCVSLTLSTSRDVEAEILETLKISGDSVSVKGLQTLQLQKTVLAVGAFSIFDALLQERLGCRDGFAEARRILADSELSFLEDEFDQYQTAINVLKHGRGRSYEKLLKIKGKLNFNLKEPDEYFFDEGDVSEVETLVEVDEKFVSECARIIHEVSLAVEKSIPGLYI